MKAYVLVNPANNRLVNNEIPNYPNCLPKYRVIYGPNTSMGITAPEWYRNCEKGRHTKAMCDAGYCAYLGHLNGFLTHLTTSPDEDLLVLEDDVQFSDKFSEYFKNFMAIVPDDWDVICLGGWPLGTPTEVTANVLRPIRAHGLECSILRSKFVKRLVDEITEGGSQYGLQVDSAIAALSARKQIKVYMPIIKFAFQGNEYSAHRGKVMNRNIGKYRYFNYININGDLVSNSDEDLKRYEDK